MADVVVVQTTAAGASVAVEAIGAINFQIMKLADGTAGSTTAVAATSGVPAAASVGLVVALKGADFTTAIPASVATGIVVRPVGSNVDITTGPGTPGATGLVVYPVGTSNVDITTAVPSVGATGLVVYPAGTVDVEIIQSNPGTAVYFGYSTALAPTTQVVAAFTVGRNLTTAAASTTWIVPASKTFRILTAQVWVRNTLASIGAANARVWVMASTAAFTSTAPVLAMVAAANITSATGAAAVGAAVCNGGIDIPAGATVMINYSMTGASSCPIEIAIMGTLFP